MATFLPFGAWRPLSSGRKKVRRKRCEPSGWEQAPLPRTGGAPERTDRSIAENSLSCQGQQAEYRLLTPVVGRRVRGSVPSKGSAGVGGGPVCYSAGCGRLHAQEFSAGRWAVAAKREWCCHLLIWYCHAARLRPGFATVVSQTPSAP